MKKTLINVGGKELPCRLSMGAMLLFKRNLQKDVSDMDANNIEELLIIRLIHIYQVRSYIKAAVCWIMM